MSEEKKLQTFDTYEYKDIIKEIEVSTAYISGLQRILTNLLMDYSEGTDKLPDLFKKFEENLNKEQEEENNTGWGLTEEQSNIYTLFSLLQLFKYNANKQGLAKKTETTATIEELKELALMMYKQEDVTEKLKDIESKIKILD